MERYYDGDQEKLYAEARVVNPYRKSITAPRKVRHLIITYRNSYFHLNSFI